MNTVQEFVARNRERLDLAGLPAPERLACVLLTPRFRASAHVVFLLFDADPADPVLVAKAARLPSGAGALEREAGILREVHAARPGGFASVPRPLACDDHAGTRILLETAVPGRVLRPALARRRADAYAEGLTTWVLELGRATLHRPAAGDAERLVDAPLGALERELPCVADEEGLAARTREATRALTAAAVPRVLTHGDLGAPNLLVSRDGAVGVVDWETAEPRGLPGQDLVFALTYLAFARRGAATPAASVAAFHEAFYSPRPWARPHLERYAGELGFPAALLEPLIVASWMRYVVALASRLGTGPGAPASRRETGEWLRGNRYHALWRHALREAERRAPTS